MDCRVRTIYTLKLGKDSARRLMPFAMLAAVLLLIAMATRVARGQDSPPTEQPKDERWSIHFQTTAIGDGHNAFAALYSGANSLDNNSEAKASLSSTLLL